MATNESVEFFLRFLNERFELFRAALKEFTKELARENREKKVEAAFKVYSSLQNLTQAIARRDRPAWIDPLATKLRWYTEHSTEADAGLTVFETIMQLHRDINGQQWSFKDSAVAEPFIDFAAAYKGAFESSRVPELFDQLIAHLQEIIDSGQVDSIRTRDALEKLIATIRANARSDYFSSRIAWETAKSFFRKIAAQTLDQVEGIKDTVAACRATMMALDTEWGEVHHHMKRALPESLSTDEIPLLDYTPTLGLPAPAPEAVDGQIVDPGASPRESAP